MCVLRANNFHSPNASESFAGGAKRAHACFYTHNGPKFFIFLLERERDFLIPSDMWHCIWTLGCGRKRGALYSLLYVPCQTRAKKLWWANVYVCVCLPPSLSYSSGREQQHKQNLMKREEHELENVPGDQWLHTKSSGSAGRPPLALSVYAAIICYTGNFRCNGPMQGLIKKWPPRNWSHSLNRVLL